MDKKILSKEKKFYTYNRTEHSTTLIYYPSTIDEIKSLTKKDIFKKKKFLIRTGKCGHGDKSCLSTSPFVISLLRFKKIIQFNTKKKTITAQSGILLVDLLEFLKNKGFYIYNIPGGKNVSLGGAISGNVHGRFSTKKFANFGDSILSLKILNKKNKIINITKKNNLFYKVIGGHGTYGIILEAKLILHKIKTNKFIERTIYINNAEEFFNFEKRNEKFFGYIDIFEKNNFSANLKIIEPKKESNFSKIEEKKIPRDINLPNFMSYFVNNLTLKILYFFLFNIKKNFLTKKDKIVDFQKSIYVSNYIYTIPSFFREGFLEMQFSVSKKKLLIVVEKLKKIFDKSKVFPIFFILKKMHSSNKKYLFNFPKYKFSLSLGFSKKVYNKNRDMFRSIYKLIHSNDCNIYVTKDEIFLNNLNKKTLKKKYLKGYDLKNKSNASSDFNEKILKKFK